MGSGRSASHAPSLCVLLQETKRLLRGDFVDEWVAYSDPEADGAWQLLSSGPVVKQLGAVLERLSGKKPPAAAAQQSKL